MHDCDYANFVNSFAFCQSQPIDIAELGPLNIDFAAMILILLNSLQGDPPKVPVAAFRDTPLHLLPRLGAQVEEFR